MSVLAAAFFALLLVGSATAFECATAAPSPSDPSGTTLQVCATVFAVAYAVFVCERRGGEALHELFRIYVGAENLKLLKSTPVCLLFQEIKCDSCVILLTKNRPC